MKEILLIAPSFYGYYKKISDSMEKKGYKVRWYDDQIEQTYVTKFERKFLPNKFYEKMYSYIKTIISKNNNNFEYVILILGYDIPEKAISLLRERYKTSRFIYYTWDSVNTYPHILKLTPFFDKVFSFDDEDCAKYSFELLPLFCSKVLDKNKISFKYDYSTVMSYFPNKDKNIKTILKSVPSGSKAYLHLYVKSKTYYCYLWLRYRKKMSVKMKDISFNKLTSDQTYNLFCSSKAVIDCPIVEQKGLTMRTFEVLGNGIKLITTNSNIKKYNFYTPDNVFVADGETKIPKTFFETPYNYDYCLGEQYSLDSFVDTLLGRYHGSYLR